MKSSVFVVSVFLCGSCIWAQGTSPSTLKPGAPPPPAPPPASAAQSLGASGQLKLRGPEAIAQQDPNRIVATINGKQITAQQAVNLLKQVPDDQRRSVTNLSTLLERVYMFDQFADEAAKLKLDQQSPWKERLALERTQLLAQAYINQMATSGPTDASKQYYDAHSADFDQVKLSGIVVSFNPPGTPASATATTRTEAQAQDKATDLEKKIKAGGDFSALARTDSDQQQSAARGGELGRFEMGDSVFVPGDATLPADIRPVVGKLQAGQVSEPIREAGGYFILKVDSRTKVPFAIAKQGIVQKLEFDKYKIQVQDQDFFSAANAPSIPSLQRPAPSAPSQPPAKPQGR